MTDSLHLVTGATGLIGSHLVRRLIEDGQRVRALVRSHSNVTELREHGLELIVGDLHDADSVRRAMADVSHVFHCAALVTDWGPRRLFQQTNVEGTRHVVDAAIAQQVQRLVHLSSVAVYGYPRRLPIDEDHPQRSRSIPYIETKIAAERIVANAHHQHGLPAVMLRPVMVFGPGCQNYVGEIARHLRRGSMTLFDGGRHVAGLAYVGNVVDAICLAGRTPEAIGRAMNICDDSPITWKEYVDALADGIGLRRARWSLPTRVAYVAAILSEAAGRVLRLRQRPWLTRLAVLELGQPQVYDISLARRILGYTPRVGFEESMRLTTAWASRREDL